MRTGAHKIQALYTTMFSLGSKTQNIEERMRESEDSAAVEVERVFPGKWRIKRFMYNVLRERDVEAGFYGLENR